MLFKLAFRNIFRNFRRTAITFGVIAITLMFLIILDSILSGVGTDSFQKIINYETGHIRIASLGYQEDKENFPLDKNIAKPELIVEKLKTNPDVAGVTERINFRIMLSDGVDQLPAVGIAVNPKDEESVFLLKQAVAKGEFLTGMEERCFWVKDWQRTLGSQSEIT